MTLVIARVAANAMGLDQQIGDGDAAARRLFWLRLLAVVFGILGAVAALAVPAGALTPAATKPPAPAAPTAAARRFFASLLLAWLRILFGRRLALRVLTALRLLLWILPRILRRRLRGRWGRRLLDLPGGRSGGFLCSEWDGEQGEQGARSEA